MAKSKIINQIKIAPETLARLISFANRDGISVGDIAGLQLDSLMTWDEPDPSDTSRYVSWLYNKAQTKQRTLNQIMTIAAQYADNGDQDTGDILERMCISAGLSMTEIVDRVGNDPLMLAAAQGNPKTPLGRAMMWLPKFLLDNNGQADHPIIMAAADRLGWDTKLVALAKAEINAKAKVLSIKSGVYVEIVSRHESKYWSWHYMSEELDSEQGV